MSQKPLKTPEQVKAEYRAKGIPLSRVAKEQGWFLQDIYKVLNGWLVVTMANRTKSLCILG